MSLGGKIKDRESKRDPVWSESIAVGSKIFIENVKEKLGISKKGRKVVENNDNDNFYMLNIEISGKSRHILRPISWKISTY
jgi:hypothetical protein